MKEREREEIYWKLSLLLLILSPLVILLFFKNNIEFSFSPPVYIISMILSIPIIFVTDIIMHLLKGKVPKFNIKSPTVKESNETKENMEKSLEEIIKRLNKLGFYIEAESYEITDNVISCLKETFNNDERFSSLRSMGKKWALKDEIFKALKNLKFTEEEIREILNYIAAYSSEEGKELRFDKGQTGHAHGYLDQIFSGIVTLKQDHFRLNIEAEVTMKDTLIMDSGEGEFLSSLCNYINLKNPDYDFKNGAPYPLLRINPYPYFRLSCHTGSFLSSPYSLCIFHCSRRRSNAALHAHICNGLQAGPSWVQTGFSRSLYRGSSLHICTGRIYAVRANSRN